jgi:class 3 adenylate cyclase
MASEEDRLRSAARGHGLRLAEQVRDGLASREALRGFAELVGLDPAIDPAVEDLDHSWARLQALGPHRPDGISSYVRPSIHETVLTRIPTETARSAREPPP